jgi:hypothetical protein
METTEALLAIANAIESFNGLCVIGLVLYFFMELRK